MRKILAIIISLILSGIITAHPWKPNHYVIIDTDGGIDDIRAISMMLASPDVRVLAIIASPGVLSAEKAYIKVKSLLNSYHHEGIAAGINRNVIHSPADFSAAGSYQWGSEKEIDPANAPDFTALIREIFEYEKTPVSFVCLAGMSTVSEASVKIDRFGERVKQVIWSCNGLANPKGFNYDIDRNAANQVIKGEVPVKAVITGNNLVFFDSGLIERTSAVNNVYAMKIKEFMSSATAGYHPFSRQANDELVPVFLHYPGLFTSAPAGRNQEYMTGDLTAVKNAFLTIVKGETVIKNQVIKSLPLDPSFYFDDIQPSVKEIIESYGEDEWTAGVIANELHRHLGVYAIIGVKMGIRAREYFDTGVDEFRVTSYAGSDPPLSCMNDGIQVSTGATPGHGLLTISNDSPKLPSCDFIYMNRRIRLTLRPEIASRVSDELRQISFIYGLDSNIYWELVRKNSIKYWKELDRHVIFIIERL